MKLDRRVLYEQLLALWEEIGPRPTSFDDSIDDLLSLAWSGMSDSECAGLPSPDDVTGAVHGDRRSSFI